MSDLTHFIGGEKALGGSRFADVYEPMTGAVIARAPLARAAEVRAAVENARERAAGWAAVNPQRRARVF